ncbi:MAG: tRNA (N(6)-L-threonylcarbamoyladenosine(37)-C(2))-methylthiotransferase MtaB [Candidatus Cloacimonetes bacterium]|nr:tRNA (N(6)-L-threonylcarbamoyladenosine(37)-C(2))-methylthiotransferase MtaB [Candidatus Cloacimonadota bacterium]
MKRIKKIAAMTFGCKINQYETSCIINEFLHNGYQYADFDQLANVYIINTCTVTNRTDQKSRNAIRKALQQKYIDPTIKIIVTGCYSQRKKQEIAELGDVNLIIDNNEKSKVYKYLMNPDLLDTQISDDSAKKEFDELFTTKMIDHSRAFIKVQDGCDNYCAYCAIPYARGTSRSRDKYKVLEQISTLTEQDYCEFVLGGINLGLYGREKKDNYFLADLLKDIEKIEKVKLIRLSSIEPQLFTNDLLEYFRNSKKICHHFHIPLQVGCDELLKKMGRKYKTEEFKNVISEIRNIIPDAALGIDVIVGLPGETEEYFQKTYNFLNELDFTYLHVFSYSKRPGTKAAEMNDQTNGKIQKQRSNWLIKLSEKKLSEYKHLILRNEVVLSGVFEQKTRGYWTALSDHFIRVYLNSKTDLKKKYLQFKPQNTKFDGIEVKLLDKLR